MGKAEEAAVKRYPKSTEGESFMNPTSSADVRTPTAAAPSGAGDFWQPRTLEDLATAQGVAPADRPEDLLGQGAELWDDDVEFERFLAWWKESRRTGG
jgi:hypothetical protein